MGGILLHHFYQRPQKDIVCVHDVTNKAQRNGMDRIIHYTTVDGKCGSVWLDDFRKWTLRTDIKDWADVFNIMTVPQLKRKNRKQDKLARDIVAMLWRRERFAKKLLKDASRPSRQIGKTEFRDVMIAMKSSEWAEARNAAVCAHKLLYRQEM